MTRTVGRLLATLALTVMGVGCSKPGRSVVQIQEITAEASLTGLTRVEIVVTRDGNKELRTPRPSFSWPPPRDIGVYLPSDVEGNVTVRAVGYSGVDQNAISSSMPTVSVKPGQVSSPIAMLHIIPGKDVLPTGGSGGAGGIGTGGNPGTGGVTGAGGTTGTGGGSASGGSVGTGGGVASGGRVGTGGSVASGGSVGTGGSTGGRGGALGTGGGVGTGGSGSSPTWGGAIKPDPNSLVMDWYPKVAVDAQGNAVVVYVHGSAIWANHYTFATNTWGTAGPVDARTGGATPPQSPTVSVGTVGAGGATQWLAVWQQDYNSATLHGIWQSTSADGVTWSTPTAITTAGLTFDPVLAMNRAGMAVAAWTDTTGALFTLLASVRPAGGAWSAPRVMHPPRDNGDRIPTVAVSGLGDAFVAWEQADDGAADQTSVWSARYAAGTGWTPEMLMESYDAYGAYSTGIAANQSGQAILTWLEPTLTTQQLWARRYTPGTGWAAGTMVTEAGDIPYYTSPSVTLDDSGTSTLAFAVTIGNFSTGKNNVYTVRADWAQAWPAPMAMETDNAAPNDGALPIDRAPSPAVGIDAVGNTVLTWRKQVGTRFDLYGRRFTVAGGWGAPALLGSQDPNGVFLPELSVGQSGTAAVVWYYANEFKVWANILR